MSRPDHDSGEKRSLDASREPQHLLQDEDLEPLGLETSSKPDQFSDAGSPARERRVHQPRDQGTPTTPHPQRQRVGEGAAPMQGVEPGADDAASQASSHGMSAAMHGMRFANQEQAMAAATALPHTSSSLQSQSLHLLCATWYQ